MAVKYRYGEDVLVRRRLTRPSTSPGASGTPLVQADITSIAYTLRRLYKGKWTTVADHDAVSLTIANVIYDTLQAWGADTIGFNFQHVIDETSLAPIADYRAIYDVLLDDGFSRQFVKSFSVVDEFDAGEQPGSSTVIVGGAPGANGADGPGYTATSTTSLAIGTGSKAFTTQSGLAYSAGARVRASSAADTSNYMEGLVTSYSGTTLTVNVTRTSGSGTLADWNINLTGDVGATGATGATGAAGATGATGPGYYATSSTSNVVEPAGTKTWTTQSGLAYVAGMRVRARSSSNPDVWMEGEVTSYSGTTLVIEVDRASGYSFATSFTFSIVGEQGDDGESLDPTGAWSSSTGYDPLDIVDYQGSSYIARIANSNVIPTSSPSTWALNASKGDTGATGSGYVALYDVTDAAYGAVGDGVTDDTAAFQACIDDVVTASANGRVMMLIPPSKIYLVQDPTSDSVASLADPSAPLHFSSSGNDIDIWGYGATLKIGENGVSNSVVRVFGDRVGIYGLTVDCNAADQATQKGNTAFEFNGGSDCFCRDCWASGGYTFDKYVMVDGTPTGGTFTITYNSNTTSALAYNVSAADMQTALRLLSGLSAVVVTSVGTLAGQVRYRIACASDLADFTVSDSVTGGTDSEVTVTNHNQGQEHFLGVDVIRASWFNCRSYDCGWTSFRSAGSDELWDGCWAIDHRGNGFRLTTGGACKHVNCLSSSSRNSGRSAFIADAGSSQEYPALRRTKVEYINCVGKTTVNDSLEVGAALLKLAAADEVIVTGGEMNAAPGRTASPNYAIRLEDNLLKVVFRDHKCTGGFIFTPSQFRGAVSAVTESWNNSGTLGYAQFTLPASHGIRAGDTIFIQDSATARWNREHVIQSDGSSKTKSASTFLSITDSSGVCLFTCAAGHNVQAGDTLTVTGSGVGAYNTTHTVAASPAPTATTFVTDRSYVSDSTSSTLSFTNSVIRVTSEVNFETGDTIGANAYAHEGVDEVRMRNVTIRNEADSTYTTMAYLMENAACRILDLEDVTMEFTEDRTSKQSGIGWVTPDAGLDLMRFKNFKVIGGTSNIFLGVKIIGNTGTDEQQTITIINTGGTPGGTFTLTCGSYGTTGSITWSSNTDTMRANIRTALRTLLGVTGLACNFTSGDYTTGAVFTVIFQGVAGNVTQLTTGTDSMTGSSHSLAYNTTVPGVVSTQLVTSGKTIGLNASIVNRGTGATYLISPYQGSDNDSPYAERAILFNSIADATGAYKATAVPSAIVVGWQQGDFVRNSATGSGARPGWHCIATTSAGSAPSFQQEAALT